MLKIIFKKIINLLLLMLAMMIIIHELIIKCQILFIFLHNIDIYKFEIF